MRASGVVQGFKSLAAKLHPQLPLSNKESQRLLTALNASFREKLDEAHPPFGPAPGESIKRHGGVTRSDANATHSSASYADKHLASVLTSSLFITDGNPLDYTSAKLTLAKDPHKDPIELLEEYHAQGAATIAIAELCLQHFKKSMSSLQLEEEVEKVRAQEPGRRVFIWFLESGLYLRPDEYRRSYDFMKLVVRYLFQEGREHVIWDWMKLDTPSSKVQHPRPGVGFGGQMSSRYKHRAEILAILVDLKLNLLEVLPDCAKSGQLASAIDAILAASEIRRNAGRQDSLHWIALGAAHVTITKWINRKDAKEPLDIDVERFERYTACLQESQSDRHSVKGDLCLAFLQLRHPKKASAARAYELARTVFAQQPTLEVQKLRLEHFHHEDSPGSHRWRFFFIETLSVLMKDGKVEDAAWLEERIREHWPFHSQHLKNNLNEYACAFRDESPSAPGVTAGLDHSPHPGFA